MISVLLLIFLGPALPFPGRVWQVVLLRCGHDEMDWTSQVLIPQNREGAVFRTQHNLLS